MMARSQCGPRALLALFLASLCAQALSSPSRHRHAIRRHVAGRVDSSSNLRQGTITTLQGQVAAAAAADTTYLRPAYQIAPVCQKSAGVQVLNMSTVNITSRVWKGWGASLAWYANFLGSLPTNQSSPVLDLLFGRVKGMGLNIVRYNIPGGYSAAKSPQLHRRTDVYKWRAYTGFKSTAAGAYNWSADANQVKVLQAAKSRGADTFVAFASSPPWYLTVSGDVTGSVTGGPNLLDNSTKAFAGYLADVVEQFGTRFNISFQSLEPFSQPTTRWKSGGLREGCTVSTTQAATFLPLLAANLTAKKLATRIAAFNDFPAILPAWVDKVGTANTAVARFSTNGYESTKDATSNHVFVNAVDYVAAGATAVSQRKEIWVSEWGPDAARGSDLGLALYMSRQIISSVTLIKASAWLYWQPLDIDPAWTLLTVNWNASQTIPLKFERTKKYWALRQFVKTVPKGAVPVDLANRNRCAFCIAAFYVPCKSQIVVVGVNQNSTNQDIQVNLDGFQKASSALDSSRTVFRTSATENFKQSNATAASVRQPLKVTLLGRSFTTVVLSNVKSKSLKQNACAFPGA